MDLTKTYNLANRGDMSAQRFLGLIYFLGEVGILRDYIESYKWLALASRQGEKTAVAVIEYVLPHLSVEDLAEAERRIRAFEKSE